MKYVMMIGCLVFLTMGCLREKHSGEDCRLTIQFNMLDVAYVFQNDEVVEFRPYYTFTEQLDLYVFAEEKLKESRKFDYAYCKTHPVIPFRAELDRYVYLFVANLYDPRKLDWTFVGGQLKTRFSIVDYEEPPVLLAATSGIEFGQEAVAVQLLMLVSRLEIRLTNPPAWVSGLDVTVRDIAATISSDFALGDTTHIQKRLWFDNQGAGSYQFGVNTFPTYPDKSALLVVELLGTSGASPILVDDNRLHLIPGHITRLDITFEAQGQITISVEVHGKWEIIDGGNIII